MKESSPNFYVVIPAAGVGVRMKADRPKQYLLFENEMILQRVVNTFSQITCIKKVVVALHPEDHWWPLLQLTNPEKVLTVVGGKTRADSVLLSLHFLETLADGDDFILVHDAARPGVTEKMVLTLIDAVKEDPVGGIMGLPIVDTVKQVSASAEIIKTVSREALWVAQTPQCFRFGLLKTAIQKALENHEAVTDESSAIEYLGYHPKMILGDSRNYKITFPDDL